MNNILMIGFTHLGLVYSSSFAKKGMRVTLSKSINSEQRGFDISYLKSEPFLLEDITQAKEANTLNFVELVLINFDSFDLIVIAEDTPINSSNTPKFEHILEILSYVDKLNVKRIPIVLMSQVYPGFCRSTLVASPLFYWVETLIFGKAIDRATNPEQIVFGLNNSTNSIPKEIDNVLKLYSCPIHKVSWETAELTKISFNFMLSMSVIGTNFLATVSESVGASWKDVSKALKLDGRIGERAYLSPGLGITGGNLPRDLSTLEKLSRNLPLYYGNFLNEVVNFNAQQYLWLRDTIHSLQEEFNLPSTKITIGLLGLAYKVGTSELRNSPSLSLAEQLPGHNFLAFDPEVKQIPEKFNIEVCESIRELAKKCKIFILVTPWPEIVYSLEVGGSSFEDILIIDCSNTLSRTTLQKFRGYRQRGEASSAG